MVKRFYLLTLFLLLFSLSGQENTTSRMEALSMRDCIIRAIQYNLEIEVSGYDPKIAEYDLGAAESSFDPIFSASYGYQRNRVQTTSIVAASKSQNGTFSSALTKPNILGGSIGVFYDLTYSNQDSTFSSFETSWEHEFGIQLSQPLLQGLGIDFNRSSIDIAKNSLDISYYQYYDQLLDTISDVQIAYWDLVNARKNYELQYQSLELARKLYNITEERIKVGSLAAAEILDAERNVALRKDQLVVAEQQIHSAEDVLKQLIRPMDVDYYKNVRIIPTEEPIFEKISIDFDEILATAINERPDIKISKIGLKNSDIEILIRKNALLPELDFSASVGVNGVSDASARAFKNASTLDFPSWSFQVSFEYPLGNRAANNRFKKALAEKKQATTNHRLLESQIILSVRNAVRDLETAIIRVATARKTRELAEKQLTNEENKFRAGLIALFQVQDTEQELTEARVEETNTLLDFQRARVNLEQAKGSIWVGLQRYEVPLKINDIRQAASDVTK